MKQQIGLKFKDGVNDYGALAIFNDGLVLGRFTGLGFDKDVKLEKEEIKKLLKLCLCGLGILSCLEIEIMEKV